MRVWLIAGLILGLTGCNGSSGPHASKSHEDVDPARLADAKRQFGGFLDEVAQGMKLLESHPKAPGLTAQSKTLHEVLGRAAEVYPAHEQMAELAAGGGMLLRYFDAALKVANFYAHQKEADPVVAQKFIDKTCQANLPFMRELWEKLREKVEP